MSTQLLEAIIIMAAAICSFCYCLVPSSGLRAAVVVLSAFSFLVGVVLALHAGL